MEVDHLAVARDQRDDAAGLVRVDERLHARVHAVEALGRDADRLGRRLWQRLRPRSRSDQRERDDQVRVTRLIDWLSSFLLQTGRA